MEASTAQAKKPYTLLEKELLSSLVENHPVVSDKRTDGTIIARKREAWKDITELFNASMLVNQKVSTKQLQRLWSNMKSNARNAKTAENQRHYTGGGETVPDMDTLDARVLNIDKTILKPIDEVLDCDNLQPETSELIREDYPVPEPSLSLLPAATSSNENLHQVSAIQPRIIIEEIEEIATSFGEEISTSFGEEPFPTLNEVPCTASTPLQPPRSLARVVRTAGRGRTPVTENDIRILRKRMIEEEIEGNRIKRANRKILFEMDLAHKKRMQDLEYAILLEKKSNN